MLEYWTTASAFLIVWGYITVTKTKSAIKILSELNQVHTIGVVFRLSITFVYL